MVTWQQRGAVFDLKRNGILIATLMRRWTKEGFEYYDWLSKLVYGSDLEIICASLTEEMGKYERVQGKSAVTAGSRDGGPLPLCTGGDPVLF